LICCERGLRLILVLRLRSDRYGRLNLILTDVLRKPCVGRNGGHLTPSVFLDFHNRQVLYGADEAVKSYNLENYTADSLVRFSQVEGLDDELDLVDGRHVTLFVTPEEEALAKVDFEAAKEAGLGGLESIRFLDRETMKKVSSLVDRLRWN
jgi:hypothetical protein